MSGSGSVGGDIMGTVASAVNASAETCNRPRPRVAFRSMDDLRVLHVIEAMHQGGAETVVLEHARHRGSTVDVAVCAINRGGPTLDAVRDAGCVTRVLDGGDGNRAWRRLTRVGRIAQLIRDERIAIVNAHNPTGALYGVPAARLAGVPAVRTEHSIHEPGRHSM